jgi:TRAP-type uncharacterized transport system substrate-binding protein
MRQFFSRWRTGGWRDALTVGLASLLLLAAGFWLAAQFVQPAPPRQLVLSSGAEGGGYQRFAAHYRDALARHGIELVELPSAGSVENLARLRDSRSGVDVAFVQSGAALASDEDRAQLTALGSVYYEPLWIFYRAGLVRELAPAAGQLDRIAQLRGRRIAVGLPGSGGRKLALDLIEANGIAGSPTTLIDLGGMAAAEALREGKVDAVMLVGPPQSALVWSLLYADPDQVRLMSLVHVDAYTRLYPYLNKVVLPRGAVDLVRDLPPHDVTLLAPSATLVARNSMHPALRALLLQVADEVHGGAGLLQQAGEFPRQQGVDFPLATEAERWYASGPPFLQRYLPFWLATLLDRLVVLLVPVVAVLLPLLKFAPMLYGWRVRSRIFRRYGELKFIEAELDLDAQRHTRAEWLARLDEIEADVHGLPTPLAFSDMLYTLRAHIELVRSAILRRT